MMSAIITVKNTSSAILLSVMVVVMLGALCMVADVRAEQNTNNGRHSGPTRSAKMLSPGTARTLSKAQEALADGRIEEGVVIVNQLLEKSDRLSAFDQARTYQILSYARVNQEDYQAAIKAAETALFFNELDLESTLELRYQLARLYLFMENYDNCLGNLDAWLELSTTPSADVYFVMAQTYALKEEYQQALRYARQGMNLHRQQQSAPEAVAPRKEWYQLLLAIKLNLNLYSDVVPLLQEMLAYWSQEYSFFLQLSSIYQQLEQEESSLAVLSIAQQNGLIVKVEDFHRLMQLYRLRNYPYKGASVFSDAIQAVTVDERSNEAKQWEDLSNAWLQAREWGRAQSTLIESAELSDNGLTWLLLCQTSVVEEQWQQSRQFCRHALDQGGLNEKGAIAWQQIALSYYHQEQLPKAMDAFAKCANWSGGEADLLEKQRTECGRWYDFVDESIAERRAEAERLQRERSETLSRRQQRLQHIDSFSR